MVKIGIKSSSTDAHTERTKKVGDFEPKFAPALALVGAGEGNTQGTQGRRTPRGGELQGEGNSHASGTPRGGELQAERNSGHWAVQ